MDWPVTPVARPPSSILNAYPKWGAFQGESFKLKKLGLRVAPAIRLLSGRACLCQFVARRGSVGRGAGAQKHRVAGQHEETRADACPPADGLWAGAKYA